MNATKPQIVTFAPRREPGLGSKTWEERRRLTAPELIKLMGASHVNHPDYKQQPRSYLPMPNLAGRLPVIQHCELGLIGSMKAAFFWILR